MGDFEDDTVIISCYSLFITDATTGPFVAIK